MAAVAKLRTFLTRRLDLERTGGVLFARDDRTLILADTGTFTCSHAALLRTVFPHIFFTLMARVCINFSKFWGLVGFVQQYILGSSLTHAGLEQRRHEDYIGVKIFQLVCKIDKYSIKKAEEFYCHILRVFFGTFSNFLTAFALT